MRTIARRLAGQSAPYPEEVELTYDIRPQWHDEGLFEHAHGVLDDALPGSGELEARYADWFAEVEIPREAVPAAVRALAEHLRERARELIGLPDGEDVEIELVEDKPWFGYAHYLGGYRTHISVNTDLPFPASDLAGFVAHEIYPGHHTHRSWQEADVVRPLGQIERTLDVLWSPDAVFSEGIAELGAELVVDDEMHEVVASELRCLGVEYDAAVGARVAPARRALSRVAPNVALLLHERGVSRDEARDYAIRWSLNPPNRVEKMLDRLVRPPSPGYVHCYSQGLDLCRAYVGAEPARLRGLMADRLLPSELQESGGRM